MNGPISEVVVETFSKPVVMEEKFLTVHLKLQHLRRGKVRAVKPAVPRGLSWLASWPKEWCVPCTQLARASV